MYYHSYLAFRRAMLWPKVLTEQLGLLKTADMASDRPISVTELSKIP
jgi:hypothetical protein